SGGDRTVAVLPRRQVGSVDDAVAIGVAVGLDGARLAEVALPGEEVGAVDGTVAVEVSRQGRRQSRLESAGVDPSALDAGVVVAALIGRQRGRVGVGVKRRAAGVD